MKQRELLVVALEVASSTAGSLSWGVAAIHSQCVALLWDSRDEAAAEVMRAAARQAVGSIVIEASIMLPSGAEVLGMFVRPADNPTPLPKRCVSPILLPSKSLQTLREACDWTGFGTYFA